MIYMVLIRYRMLITFAFFRFNSIPRDISIKLVHASQIQIIYIYG